MHLHSLAFRNFRRLKHARIEFADDLTIFVGANNSGKTSATHAIELFLSGAKEKFTIHDFSADCWAAFEANPAEGDDAPPFELPVISLDVWISVDADNLYRVVELLPRAAWEGSLVGIRIEFSAKDANQTFANFRAKAEEAAKFSKTKDKDGQDYKPWPRNMRDFLSRELRNEFGLRYFILDEAQLKPGAPEEAFETKEMIADAERSGHTVINSLIKVDFLSAQRHLSDGNSQARTEDLSKRLSRFYTRNQRKRDDDHNALMALAISEEQLTKHFAGVFSDTFRSLRKLGYPGLANPTLEIRAALKLERLMGDQQAKVHYLLEEATAEVEALVLPDSYNGSGKTTSIVKALDHLRKTQGAHLRQRAQKVACITYTEVAVDEIWGDVGNDPLFHVSTIHSFLWAALKPFQADIALWVDRRIDQKIADTEAKIAAFTKRTHEKTRLQAAADVERYRDQKQEIKSVKNFNYSVGSNYPKGVLGHDDVIRLSTELIQGQPLIAKVVGQKFPFIFVDESQDTAPDVVSALKAICAALGSKFCLGFIGDPMQKIYTSGAGVIAPLAGWKVIEKPENFRCPTSVLTVINNIRAAGDALVQTGGKTKLVGGKRVPVVGTAKLLVVPKDDRAARLAAVRDWLAKKHDDPLWLSDAPEADVKVLVIAHRMAAERLGFGSLYDAYHDKTSETLKEGFDEGTHWSVLPFLKLLMPLVIAQAKGDQFEVMSLLRRHAPSLQRNQVGSSTLPAVLKELDSKVKVLAETCAIGSSVPVFEALSHLKHARMFGLDDRLLSAMAEYDAAKPITDSGDAAAVQKLLHLPMSELWGYRTYIEEQSPFETHQGVKGAEFTRVITIIDDEEGRHNQFSYGKLFGITPPSDTDNANAKEGKETTYDRTRRLLYVCCSRAGQDLAIVFVADDPAGAHAAIANLGIFPPEDVHNLA